MATITNPLVVQPVLKEEESQENLKKLARKGNILYLILTGTFFTCLFFVFLFLPRPTYSELEKRDLASFPEFKSEELSEYPVAVSGWFSDSQPYRDHFLTMSMNLRNAMKFAFRSDEDAVSFIATADEMETDDNSQIFDDRAETQGNDPNSLIAENAKIGNKGIVVAGNAPNARAMMAYGAGPNGGDGFVKLVNTYAETFPGVTMYVVTANTSGEFYMPPKVSGRNKSQLATLEKMKEGLAPNVRYVDVWSALNSHKAEDIFSRTDHHWAPLGAYYAAKAFAQVANVPFKNLDSYERHVIHNYVGSMYGYSKDINVKNSPEDFIYYTPTGVNYKSEFISYSVNENFQVTSASKPYESEFFKSFSDGNGNAYCTFMGGDRFTVHIKTDAPSKRKLLIIKDSYGNAVPGYLFYGFSDIHIVDFRYFNKNMKKYVADNGITDMAFVMSIFKVCTPSVWRDVLNFLTQEDGKIVAAQSSEKTSKNTREDKKVEKQKAEEVSPAPKSEAEENAPESHTQQPE